MEDNTIKPLTGLLPDEIVTSLDLSRSYQGKQIFSWIHSGAISFEEMTDLPKYLRSELTKERKLFSSEISKESVDEDGTVKITLRLKDDSFVEAVLLEDETGRKTACISSQVGCAMGCSFCKTASMGLYRNLDPGEIVEQYILLKNKYGKISHIVFMGMGEPLANLESVRKAIEIFHNTDGPNIGLRKITISTCGIISGIEDLTRNGPAVKLAVSLVSADEEIRKRLMPVTTKNPLDSLRIALKKYQEKTKKRFTLEYVLLGGINDKRKDAEKVRHFIGDIKAVVNVIPWNPAEGLPYSEPTQENTDIFLERLEELRVPVTRRYRRGRGINGACGQLAVFQNSPDSSNS